MASFLYKSKVKAASKKKRGDSIDRDRLCKDLGEKETLAVLKRDFLKGRESVMCMCVYVCEKERERKGEREVGF